MPSRDRAKPETEKETAGWRDPRAHTHRHGGRGGAGREQGLISVPLPQADITHFISGQYETGS